MKEQYDLLDIHTNPIFENKSLLVQDINKDNVLSKSLYNTKLDKDILNKLTQQELNDNLMPILRDENKMNETLRKNQQSILTNPIFSK